MNQGRPLELLRRAAASRGGRLRLILSIVFFGGLAALEISRGLARLDSQRERHRRELTELFERQTGHLAREVEELLGHAESHAAHLTHNPLVIDALLDPTPKNDRALERLLLPYLVSFRGIDRICVLDAIGLERVRCERMGEGVAAIPRGLMADAPRSGLAQLVEGVPPGEIVVSSLLDDADRVEVEEGARRVFHYASSIEVDGQPLGTVIVTVYAAPLLRALEESEPLPGVTSALIDARGTLFASPRPISREALVRATDLGSRQESGGEALAKDDFLIFVDPLRGGPAALLVTVVPAAALARAIAPPRGETLRVAVTTAAIIAMIAMGSAYFVHASLRAQRLRETEHFLERIRRESGKHRALMEAAADLILVVDPQASQIHDWNRRAGHVLGLTSMNRAPEREAAPLEDVRPAFLEEGFAALRDCVLRASANPSQPTAAATLVVVESGGERMELDARCVAIEYGDERMVEVLLVDRTREREMERQIRTAERLSSLGLLTAGVAHEINNPLEGVSNYLGLLERPGLVEERRVHYVGQVRRGFKRIRDIVGDLLSFARPDPDPGVADLKRAVLNALGVARFATDVRSVQFDLRGLDEAFLVPGSEGRLEQVILNLVLNAGRAMAGRGTIRISARVASEWAELIVEDEGPGIPSGDLDRIFDPFFTRSGGSGLGLAVSYGIVKAHGGVLEAGNVDGGGARFIVRLPLGAATVSEPDGEKSREQA